MCIAWIYEFCDSIKWYIDLYVYICLDGVFLGVTDGVTVVYGDVTL